MVTNVSPGVEDIHMVTSVSPGGINVTAEAHKIQAVVLIPQVRGHKLIHKQNPMPALLLQNIPEMTYEKKEQLQSLRVPKLRRYPS